MSSEIPKHFAWSVRGTFWPSNLRFGRLDFSSLALGVKNENFVSLLIPILSESLFASSQFSKDSSSVLAIWNNVSFVLWKMKMFVSSANNFGTAVLNAFEMSFIYISEIGGVLVQNLV